MKLPIADLMDDCCPEQVAISTDINIDSIKAKTLARISTQRKSSPRARLGVFVAAVMLMSMLIGSIIATAHFIETYDLKILDFYYKQYEENRYTQNERERILVEHLKEYQKMITQKEIEQNE